MRNIQRTFLGCIFAATAGGCSTYVTSTEGTDFNRSVKIVADNLRDSLAEVQSLEVANSVDTFAKGNQRTLEHLAVDPKLSDSTVKVITGQFDFLVCYSEALKNAASPGSSWGNSVSSVNSAESKLMGDTQAFDNKLTGKTVITDTNVQTFDTDADRVAKAVSSIGEAALTLYGEEKASKIAAAVDPDLQKYCVDLESLLTSDPDSKTPRTGLAGILVADYEERIATVKYLATTAAPPSGPDDPNYFMLVQQRSAILDQYMALLEREKNGLAKVLALRKAVVEIASAHGALARKDDATFKEKISNSEELVRSITKSGTTSDDTSSQ